MLRTRFIFGQNKVDHQVTCCTGPDHQVAQEAPVVFDIVKRISLAERKTAQCIPDGVAGFRLKKTGVNIDHLVKGARYMKPECRNRRQACRPFHRHLQRIHLCLCKIFFGTKRKLQFVSVIARFVGAYDGHHLW